ncbi:MAG: nicotinamide riboside transporter PnuC, partial [Nitrospira sp.]|nr:nicotinamide riboside transporter PnuC [Nitrospira sp.]
VLYIFIFYQVRLYSDMLLQVIYVFLQIYGWYNWLYGSKDRGELQVSHITGSEIALWTVVAVGGTSGLGFSMDRYTNADLPYWDATATVLSLIAQWLMAKKILECWLIWITVDVLSMGIYTVKGLYLTTGLYAVFLGLATSGLFAWKKTLVNLEPA